MPNICYELIRTNWVPDELGEYNFDYTQTEWEYTYQVKRY